MAERPISPQDFGINYGLGADAIGQGIAGLFQAKDDKQEADPLVKQALWEMVNGRMTPEEAALHVHAGRLHGTDPATTFGLNQPPNPYQANGTTTLDQPPGAPPQGAPQPNGTPMPAGGAASPSAMPTPGGPQLGSAGPAPTGPAPGQYPGLGGMGVAFAQKNAAGAAPPSGWPAGGQDPAETLSSGIPGLSQADVTRARMGMGTRTLGDQYDPGKPMLSGPSLGGPLGSAPSGPPPGAAVAGAGGGPPWTTYPSDFSFTKRDLRELAQVGGLRALGVQTPAEREILQTLKNKGTMDVETKKADTTVRGQDVRKDIATAATGQKATSDQAKIDSAWKIQQDKHQQAIDVANIRAQEAAKKGLDKDPIVQAMVSRSNNLTAQIQKWNSTRSSYMNDPKRLADGDADAENNRKELEGLSSQLKTRLGTAPKPATPPANAPASGSKDEARALLGLK